MAQTLPRATMTNVTLSTCYTCHMAVNPDQFKATPELWHGSPHYFRSGDTVEPRVRTGEVTAPGEKLAWASPDWHYAALHARVKAEDNPQGSLFLPVNKVEPIGPMVRSKGSPYGRNPNKSSRKGFKVVGHQTWVKDSGERWGSTERI